MDLGNLFVLINYHHMMEGRMVDIDGIIEKNLQAIQNPTHTISTRHIFRKVSHEGGSGFGKQFSHRSGYLQIDPKKQSKSPNTSGTTHTSENFHLKTVLPKSSVNEKLIETENSSKRLSYRNCTLENCGKINQASDENDSNIIEKRKLNNTVQYEIHCKPSQKKTKFKDGTETVGFKGSECMYKSNGEDYFKKESDDKSNGREIQADLKRTEKSFSIQSSALKTCPDQDTNIMERTVETLVKAQACFCEIPVSSYSTPQHMETDAERSDSMSQEHVHALEMVLLLIQSKIKQIVKFSKSIPGFSDLSIHDRLLLMKGSKSESQMLGSIIVDSQNRTFQLSSNKKMGVEVVQKLFPKEYLEQKFVITQKLNALHLSAREMAVLRAIIITYPDREGLEDQHAVCELYQKLTACFLHVLKQDGCLYIPDRICQIEHVLKFMRESTLTFNHVLASFFEKSNKLNNYGIIKEFMDM